MIIFISTQPQSIKPFFQVDIVNAIQTMGSIYGVDDYEVSITFTDNKTIHQLNKMYRNIDRPTDVLSFAFSEADEPPIFNDSHKILGDIIISVEQAALQAHAFGHSFKRELVFLGVHAMLHFSGRHTGGGRPKKCKGVDKHFWRN